MIKVYADLIRKGVKTLDDVPEKLRDAVEALLKEEQADKQVDTIS